MSEDQRGKLLRAARQRALARLRAANEEQYQQLMDEEIARAGGEPRLGTMPYRPRNTQLLNDYNTEREA